MKNIFKITAFVLIICFAFLQIGCTVNVSGPSLPKRGHSMTSSPLPTEAPASSPEPTPSISDEELEEIAKEAFADAFSIRFKYKMFFSKLSDLNIPTIMDSRVKYISMSKAYRNAVQTAVKAAVNALGKDRIATIVSIDDINWREIAVLCRCEEKLPDKLTRLMNAEITVSNGVLNINVTLPEFDDYFDNESPETHYCAYIVNSYLYTVYDDDGYDMMSDGKHDFPENYAVGLTLPIEGKKHLKECWYGDRSHASRRHMGNDIRVSEGRNILSVTDGTVKFNGYSIITGNYVMIEDDLGYCYTYCHMVEPSTLVNVGDRVTVGQVVGNVGNTGNSDAPHLHISVIAPDRHFVDPYPLLCMIRDINK